MADKARLLLMRSLRSNLLGVGKQSRPKSILVIKQAALSRCTSTLVSPIPSLSSRKNFSLSNQEIDNMNEGQSASEPSEDNAHRDPKSDVKQESTELHTEEQILNETPALFQPFMATEDPVMYEKGTFQYLFENSQFVKANDPAGKEVEAEVVAVVGEKVYVDFGCKFHAVVPCPQDPSKKKMLHRGAKVVIVVKDLEVTDHFIGDTKHNSRLEAEAEFVRLVLK